MEKFRELRTGGTLTAKLILNQ